jgi:hypothetical protein
VTFPAGSEVKGGEMKPVVINTTKQDTTVNIKFQGKQASGSLKVILEREKKQVKAVESKAKNIPMPSPEVKYEEEGNRD